VPAFTKQTHLISGENCTVIPQLQGMPRLQPATGHQLSLKKLAKVCRFGNFGFETVFLFIGFQGTSIWDSNIIRMPGF
jgi:hypothetical protein